MKKVAVLTGGGCAPGLDPFLESLTKALDKTKFKILGIRYGWEGLLASEPNSIRLTWPKVEGLSRSGGTLIGTSRANPLNDGAKTRTVVDNLQKLGVEGLVAFGGDDTLTVAAALAELGDIKIISVPKTMDLDLNTTDYSVGFWAYSEAVFRNVTPGFIETLKAHRRVGVLELFGRHSGFTVVVAGIAAGACFIAIPEQEIDLDLVAARVKEFYQRNSWALVVLGEAVKIETADQGKIDPHGNELLFQKRIGEFFAREIEQMTGFETRAFQATHPFRGIPSAYDAMIGFRLGLKAAEMVKMGHWNKMIAVKGEELIEVPLDSFKPRRVITPGTWWWDLVEKRNQGKI